jgi:uncharacterized membrane protein YphA (DoxX/SURF4 family)
MPVPAPAWILETGRILFTLYFLLMGGSHLLKFTEHAALLRRKGVPLPAAATALTIVMMIGGSVLVLLNWHRAVGAALRHHLPGAFLSTSFLGRDGTVCAAQRVCPFH